jgi:integrase/recombinase XerD
MSKSGLLGPWVKRFLLDHLIEERNLSRNTQRSYRDTLALLMPYASAQRNRPVDRLDVPDLSSEVLRSFLDHLEQSRRCSIRTRNQRLAAIHAMARFIAERSPEHIAWCGQIRASDSHATNSPTWTSRRWMPSSPLPTVAQSKAAAITHSCCSSTTPVLVSRKPRLC